MHRNKATRVKNQLVFRQAVKLLLGVLSKWEYIDRKEHGGLSLIIEPVLDLNHVSNGQYNKSSLRKVGF